MASCPRCGTDVRTNAKFCPSCGYGLDGRLAPGSELMNGGYGILRSISKGGMGAVYLAEDRHAFDRLCIVKQMLEYYDPSDPEERQRAQERFEEEGRTLASLSHPGIPRIFAFFQERGRYYIVMEYIQGENLESFVSYDNDYGQKVQGRGLPQEEIIRFVIQVCNILEYLHSQPRPVVHQDIKPANLIRESQLGEVRLVDFGTARARIPRNIEPTNNHKSSIYGTDGYAPPEQYRGRPEPRSDVFALAATAYHLLTDDDPRDHPFKWPKINKLPREVSLSLQRALRNDPSKRSSASELRQALEALSTPQRTLQVFTFPGGSQIQTVGALPSLCDEHWDAAKSFLYNEDFQRWLRDINRHDLVIAADKMISSEKNWDAGLESFLHIVDPGLASPKIVLDQGTVDLGAVARESALIRKVTAINVARGYVQASVSSSEPWLEVYPPRLDLLAGVPADIRINVRAETLPLRSEQRGIITISANGQDPLLVPVSAKVSLSREFLRLTWRALSAAIPESWRTVRNFFQHVAHVTQMISRPLVRHPILFWLIWAILGAGVGGVLYYLEPFIDSFQILGYTVLMPKLWTEYVPPAVLGPPALVMSLWMIYVGLGLFFSSFWGFVRGAFKSFSR